MKGKGDSASEIGIKSFEQRARKELTGGIGWSRCGGEKGGGIIGGRRCGLIYPTSIF